MSPSRLHSSVEALLFASDQPLSLALLAEALEAPADEVSVAIRELGDAYAEREAGVQLREMAGGWLFMTAPEQNEVITRMLRGKRKARLSRPALETLSIVAYKQPVTKGEMEAIRGVDCSGTLATLLERDLVTIKGRSTVVGRPLLYGTTPGFLDYFGLNELAELPRPEELRALIAARDPEQMEMLELEPASGLPLALAAAATGVLEAEPGAGDASIEARARAMETEAPLDEDEDEAALAEADEALADVGYPARARAHEDIDFLEETGLGMAGDLAPSDADALELSGDDEDEDEDDAADEDEDDDEEYDDDLDDDEEDDEEEDESDEEEDADERSRLVLRAPEGEGR